MNDTYNEDTVTIPATPVLVRYLFACIRTDGDSSPPPTTTEEKLCVCEPFTPQFQDLSTMLSRHLIYLR